MQTLKLMTDLWPMVFGMLTVITALVVTVYQVRQHQIILLEHGRLLSDLADVDKVVRGRLYTREGMAIFMPRSACDRCRAECHTQMVERSKATTDLFNTRFDNLEKLIKRNGHG